MDKVSKAQRKASDRYRRRNLEKVYKQSQYRAAERFLTEMVTDLDDVKMYQEVITERFRQLDGKDK